MIRCRNCGGTEFIEFKDHKECLICGYVLSENDYEENESQNNIKALNSLTKSLQSYLSKEILDFDLIASIANQIISIDANNLIAQCALKFINRNTGPDLFKDFINNLPNANANNVIYEIIFEFIINNSEYKFFESITNALTALGLYQKYNNLLYQARVKLEKQEDYFSNHSRDVFVCYSSNDLERVKEIVKIIEDAGYTAWYADRNMPKNSLTQSNYKATIEEAISKCPVFLYIMSCNSILSNDTRWEIEVATKYNVKGRIQYRIEDVSNSTTTKLFFDGIQWIDAIDSSEETILLGRINSSLNGLDSFSNTVETKDSKFFIEDEKIENTDTINISCAAHYSDNDFICSNDSLFEKDDKEETLETDSDIFEEDEKIENIDTINISCAAHYSDNDFICSNDPLSENDDKEETLETDSDVFEEDVDDDENLSREISIFDKEGITSFDELDNNDDTDSSVLEYIKTLCIEEKYEEAMKVITENPDLDFGNHPIIKYAISYSARYNIISCVSIKDSITLIEEVVNDAEDATSNKEEYAITLFRIGKEAFEEEYKLFKNPDTELSLWYESIFENQTYNILSLACRCGNIDAYAYIGLCYKYGISVEKDANLSRKYIEISANENSGFGCYQLAKIYEEEKNEESNSLAFSYYKKAAQLGYDNALISLGKCYYYGIGTQVNPLKAVECYVEATKMNNPRGFYNLGHCFIKGNGVSQDINKGVALMKHAQKLGLKEAEKYLKSMNI